MVDKKPNIKKWWHNPYGSLKSKKSEENPQFLRWLAVLGSWRKTVSKKLCVALFLAVSGFISLTTSCNLLPPSNPTIMSDFLGTPKEYKFICNLNGMNCTVTVVDNRDKKKPSLDSKELYPDCFDGPGGYCGLPGRCQKFFYDLEPISAELYHYILSAVKFGDLKIVFDNRMKYIFALPDYNTIALNPKYLVGETDDHLKEIFYRSFTALHNLYRNINYANEEASINTAATEFIASKNR